MIYAKFLEDSKIFAGVPVKGIGAILIPRLQQREGQS